MSSVHAQLDQYLAQMTDPANAVDQGVWLQTRVPGMIRETGFASELVRRIATEDVTTGEGEPPEHHLLATLLDEARRAVEDGRGEGKRFLAAVNATIDGLDPAQATPGGRRALARLHARAMLTVPEALIAAHPGEWRDGQELPPEDIEAGLMGQLEKFLDQCDGDLYQLHSVLIETLAGLPEEGRCALIHHLAGGEDPRWQRLGMYWLLDRDPATRAAVASAWRERAHAGTLDALIAARMPLLRSWLPDDAARRAVDEALASTRRQQLSAEPFADAGEWTEAVASLPDGAGAQYVAVAVTAGPGRQTWAMVLIKAGYGVRDAYLLADLDPDQEDEVFKRFQQEMDTTRTSRETVEWLLSAAIADNLAAGVPPANGLIEVAATLGLGELRPQAQTVAGLRRFLDPAGELEALSPQKRGRLINRSGDWAEVLQTLDSWFEDTSTVDEILAATVGRPRVRERELRAHLDSRRSSWAGLCLRSALVLRDTDESDLYSSLLATGAALLDGRALKKVPLMEQVLARTIEAWHGRMADEGHPDAGVGAVPAGEVRDAPVAGSDLVAGFSAAEQATLASFFEGGPGAQVWPAGLYGVHGYLFAVATHPDMLSPSDWLPALLGDDSETQADLFADQDQLTTVLGALLALYNAINDQVLNEDPELPPGCEVRQPVEANFWPDGPLGQWSWGFREVRRRFGHQFEAIHASLDEAHPQEKAVITRCEHASFTLEALSDPQLLAEVIQPDPASGRRPTLAETTTRVVDDFPDCLRQVVATALAMRQDSRDANANAGNFPAPAHAESPQRPIRRHKVGRNESCPCGSGRKYKRCCGARSAG